MRIAMGTWVTIEAAALAATGTGPTVQETEPPRIGATAEAAVEAAFIAISQIESLMHPHREGSDLDRINTAPLHTPTLIDSSTWEVLTLAKRLTELTDGVFDPCLPCRPGCMSDIELHHDTDGHRIATCHAPVALDCGGIAKGFAVDRAIQVLAAHGCVSGLVNAGGDLRVFGPRTEPVLLRLPNGDLRQLELSNEALAVSDAGPPQDTKSNHRPPEHQGYYTRVHTASNPHRFAAVLAREAVTADALTKCLLLCPPNPTEKILHLFEAERVLVE